MVLRQNYSTSMEVKSRCTAYPIQSLITEFVPTCPPQCWIEGSCYSSQGQYECPFSCHGTTLDLLHQTLSLQVALLLAESARWKRLLWYSGTGCRLLDQTLSLWHKVGNKKCEQDKVKGRVKITWPLFNPLCILFKTPSNFRNHFSSRYQRN